MCTCGFISHAVAAAPWIVRLVCRSVQHFVQTEKSQQLLDGQPWNLETLVIPQLFLKFLHQQVDIWGFDLNISTTVADIYVPIRLNCINFSDHVTFPLPCSQPFIAVRLLKINITQISNPISVLIFLLTINMWIYVV